MSFFYLIPFCQRHNLSIFAPKHLGTLQSSSWSQAENGMDLYAEINDVTNLEVVYSFKYSYLSNKRSPTIIHFGKIFQALRSY